VGKPEEMAKPREPHLDHAHPMPQSADAGRPDSGGGGGRLRPHRIGRAALQSPERSYARWGGGMRLGVLEEPGEALLALDRARSGLGGDRLFLEWATKNWYPYQAPTSWRILESILGAAVTAGILGVVLYQYNRRRPGVLRWSKWLLTLWIIGPLTLVVLPSGSDPVAGFWLREFEVTYAAMFAASVSLLWLCGGRVPLRGARRRRAQKRLSRERSRRAQSRTGRLMLALPAFVFLSVTVILWALIAKFIENVSPVVSYQSLLGFVPDWNVQTVSDLMRVFLNGPFERTLPALLLVLLLAIVRRSGASRRSFSRRFSARGKAGREERRIGKGRDLAESGVRQPEGLRRPYLRMHDRGCAGARGDGGAGRGISQASPRRDSRIDRRRSRRPVADAAEGAEERRAGFPQSVSTWRWTWIAGCGSTLAIRTPRHVSAAGTLRCFATSATGSIRKPAPATTLS